MIMNQMIENVLSGDIGMDIFLVELENNRELQQYVRNFVPVAAKEDPSHDFWKIVPYQSMYRNDFDYLNFLFWGVHFDCIFGAYLNIFGRIKRAYQYYYPGIRCTNKYNEMFDVYLDAIRDCFDGPEVRSVVNRIISDALLISPKSQRSKCAKKAVKNCFHVEKKWPRWVHGPEWPMGSGSPMAFLSQKTCGEWVDYEFEDVETGEKRTVKQYF